MKKLLPLLLAFAIAAAACTKQNATPETPVDEMVDTATSNLQYSGTFINGNEGTVSGTANVYIDKGAYKLQLKDFSVTNGPDLHVYLSQEIQPIHFIDLGKLKSTSGNQVYDISGMPDFNEYKYALIHCQQYNVLFGQAAMR